MNICFLFGTINSNINFEFVLNQNEHISVASCFILSQNEIEILLYAFDEIADKLYSNYERGLFIRLEGNVTNNYVEVNRIYEY